MTEEQKALLMDARLSDAARILGLHISQLGDGEHALAHDSLAALLHGCPNSDTVGRHLRQLIVHGYIERTSPGGRSHPRYKWVGYAREKSRVNETFALENSRAKDEAHNVEGSTREFSRVDGVYTLESSRVNDMPAKNHGHTALPLKIHGHNGASRARAASPSPSTSPSTPSIPTLSPPNGSGTGIEAVRAYLGSDVVDTAIASGVLNEIRLSGILGMYGPGVNGEGGTQAKVFGGLSPPERQQALATAVLRFALDAPKFSNPLFERYLKRAIDNDWTDSTARNGNGRGRRSHAGGAAGEAGSASRRAPRGEFIVEG